MSIQLSDITKNISEIARTSPELEGKATNAISAIQSSWGRSQSATKYLSLAARHSIAVYLMTFVSFCLESFNGKALPEAVRELFRIATTYGDITRIRHKESAVETPFGWEGKIRGPWSRKVAKQYELTLFRNPDAPGGEWSIAVNGAPLFYGNDIASLEIKTTAALQIISKSGRKNNKSTFFTSRQRF